MYSHTPNNNSSININTPMAFYNFSNLFTSYLETAHTGEYTEIVIVCIGTDRSTGDSLGPLVGYKLDKYTKRMSNFFVHGTLEKPVHAKNLHQCIDYIHSTYKKPFIIAIDACLGKSDHIGHIKVNHGPLKPGTGVNKDLPSIGHMHVTGIVNLYGFMEYVVLQNTRLGLVMKIADIISEGIRHSMWKFSKTTYKEQSN